MKATSEVFYLYAARAARGFGDGFAAIILPAYLIEIGFNPFEIGVVAAAALLGSAVLTLAIGREAHSSRSTLPPWRICRSGQRLFRGELSVLASRTHVS
jgi:hypothetical protein